MDKEIIWQSWESQSFQTKNGQPSKRRVLVSETGSIGKCLDQLIDKDLKHPLKTCTFFQHFYTQIYQQKMYKSCLDNLKVGECLLIQDFSRNRDIFFQNEIKSSNWTKKQVTVHPTVIYF